ncbi:MAG TPA: efflux RND transporter periplasmic adaptor subunit [Anaerolineae bacterium]|nr:efflux RND transporter periplasmic adaptor subunit [Anaerolineae bacterium]
MLKFFIVVLVVALLGVAGWWVYDSYFPSAAEPQQEREEVRVERGTLLALVNATGTVLPKNQTTLSFLAPGQVAEVLVEEGQFVAAGTPLARLETAELRFAISQAEVAVATAQAQLLSLQREPAEYDVAAAEAALASAQASYRRLLGGASEDEITVARANLDQAEATLRQAQSAYDQVADRPDVAMLPQALQLEQATVAYEAAQASFDLAVREASDDEIAAARSAVVQAEAGLARLRDGMQEEDLLLAQLQVEQAQIALEQAQHQLEGTELRAPHDGVVTVVGIREGELSASQPAFILTDLSEYHLDVVVDEIDIGRVAVGQPVTVTLDALPGEVLGGEVVQIDDTAVPEAVVVSYLVTVRLDPTDAPLRAGMTANVDLVIERREEALLVPNRFIRIDRSTGRVYVDKVIGGQALPVEIQTGLRDETRSEILAGLDEGDVVALVQESSDTQLLQSKQAMSPH